MPEIASSSAPTNYPLQFVLGLYTKLLMVHGEWWAWSIEVTAQLNTHSAGKRGTMFIQYDWFLALH